MSVRALLVASVAAAFVIEGGQIHAQDNSNVTNLPKVEVEPPQTGVKPGRSSEEKRVVRPVRRIYIYPTAPLTSVANDADKVPASINYVDSNDIKRTGSLNVMDALQQNVAGLNITDVAGNPFQANVEFRGFVGSPVAGTPQG